MEQLGSERPFSRFVAESLKDDLVLIDVGAAFGVAPAWRSFGDKLRGFGFDPDAAEIERLNSIEPAPRFRYITGYVGISPDHPFAVKRRGVPWLGRNPWPRLGVERWLEIQRARNAGQPLPPNLPLLPPRSDEREADVGVLEKLIGLPDFLEAEGIGIVDFLKVDVDGPDYDILQSMAGCYDKFGILGVGIEVNFFGSGSDTENSFHNIDRFLKGEGFELFDVTVRRYPIQDLPGPSIVGHPYPGSSAFGRPFQGDAIYARDLCAPSDWEFAERLDDERLAKAAALFALFGCPDSAAEVLVTFRERLERLFDVGRGLDLLAEQAQPGHPRPLSYRDYIRTFEKESYASGGVYKQGAATGGAARRSIVQKHATKRPLVPGVYRIDRRAVHAEATCVGETRLSIRTPAGLWHHSVEFPLDAAGLDPDSRLVVTLGAAVRRGIVGLGILSADGKSLPDEIQVDQSGGASMVELVSGRVCEAGPLLVRNAADDGASEVELEILGLTLLE